MSETMDVVQSLLKISRELLEQDPVNNPEDVQIFLSGCSWLVEYIAKSLEVELQHAANRGRLAAMNQIEQAPGPNGVKNFSVMSGEDI